MNTTLLVATTISWGAIIALAITVLALVRQVGLLHERISPAGALSIDKQSLRAGEPVPSFQLPSLTGGNVTLGADFPQARCTLLFFLSETCPVCKTLLPVLTSVAKQEQSWLNLVFASDGDKQAHLDFIERRQLQAFPYVLSMELGVAFEIGKLPYGVLIEENGKLISHGLVNTREHLESLIEARRLGAPTVQTFMAAQTSA
ncbi:redoxin domain-containing protein [Pseudomaricurvus alkylphenolicus]|jgi:methylamine dehydrogenase accessory protein MauD|uniref:redoxin domain-containing protein n=1 Tax=Pseudomaricurvus alkylphenolicus TaxID=1306991 RepID=UPI00141DB653|nr:redoxin domain-containing protein [Pseudomaricurvus alkylphenolicus]NIB44708.1 redoxin domain-containing protein [Pseudomaricurvus alkylphenolicus]